MTGGILSSLIDPLNPQPTKVELSSAIDTLGDQAGDLVGRIAQYNHDALQAIQGPADAITTKIQGSVLAQLASHQVKSGKIIEKLVKARNRQLGNAYQGIFPAGGSWQPIEHVVAGLQSGDIFGPVGLAPQPQQPGDGNVVPPPILPDPVGFGGGPGGGPGGVPGNPQPVGGGVDPGGVLPVDGKCPPGLVLNSVTGKCISPYDCPQGWWVNPLLGVCMPLGGDRGPPPPPPPLPPPIPPCNDFIRVTCAATLLPPTTINGHVAVQPVCFEGNPNPPEAGWVLVSYNWVPPGQTQSFNIKMWIPGGWFLCVDKQDGTVYASERLCSDSRYCSIDFMPTPEPPPPPTAPPPGEVCAPPPAADCPPGPSPLDSPGDQGDEYCEAIAKMIAAWSGSEAKFTDWLGMVAGNDDGSWVSKAAAEALTGQPGPILPGLIQRFKIWAEKSNRAAVESLGCGSGTMAALTVIQGISKFIQKWLDILPPQFMRALEQSSNTICQSLIPTQSEGDMAYLNNTITLETWRCWTQANGNYQKPAADVMHGMRTKPNAREVDLLYRRGLIDQGQWDAKMRAAGVLNADDQGDIANLNLQFPDRADLVRFMVRDVFDEEVSRKSGLSIDFDKKFTGDALKYADALGIPRNHMLYAWRAHWQLPSLTMAGQMLARCRPGRVPDEAVVSEDDVLQLLKQDDWAPGWIPSMMELLKQPLTRVDTRRMYQIHAATEVELKEYYLDLRYDDATADKLVKFAKTQRDVAEAKASGLPGQRTAIQQFARGEMTSDELAEVLAKISLTPELAETAKQSAQLARSVYRRGQAIKGTKRQYVAGLVDDGEATQMLLTADVDGQEIQELLELWTLDKRDKGKHASAAQLCQWRAINLISPVEQADALVRTGWSVDDAARIVSQCDMTLSSKAAKMAEKAAKEAMKQMEKDQKEALAALKQRGKLPGPPSRRIVIVRDAKGQHETDTTTVPIIPAEMDIAAAAADQ